MEYEEFIFHLNRKLKNINKEIVYVCIGSSKIIWDSVGPRVGTLLKNELNNVVGDMKNNFNSKKDYLLNYKYLKNKYIVAIDSAFIDKKIKEEVFITNESMIMGAGINKNIGKIGDLSIKAIINKKNIENEKEINSLSEFIANGIKSLNL